MTNESKFGLLEFLIEESSISRKPNDKEIIAKIEIHPQGLINSEKKLFQLSLLVNVIDKNESFSARIKAVGLFRFENDVVEATLDNYFYINAPAILFPYVRSYISALTALSGMPTFSIPVMNLSYLMEELKANTKDTSEEN